MDKKAIKQAITDALALSRTAERGKLSGCGRVYIAVSGDKATINAVSAACKKASLMFLRKAYGTGGNVIYFGYDNADGRASGQAELFAKTLNTSGISCYVDYVGD